jgi:DNA-binding transcriptional LysR family regulator
VDHIAALIVFVRVAEARSFVAAGNSLGLSASAVCKRIAALEQKIGVRLLHRTTRKVSVTDEGQLFLERCQRILDAQGTNAGGMRLK